MSEVRAAVGGVVVLRSVLVPDGPHYLEFLARRLQFSLLDQNVLLGRDQLNKQNTNG